MRWILAIALMFAALAGAAALSTDTGGERMIRGLDALPRITREQLSMLPESSGGVKLTLKGEPLPYDARSNTYFIPQSPDTERFEGAITLEKLDGFEYYIYMGEYSKAEALSRSIGCTIVGVSDAARVSSKLLFTPLPVICLSTVSGNMPTDDDCPGELRAYSAEGGALTCVFSNMEINLRGNTSKRHPKNSYRVQLMDELGRKRKLSLFGMRVDDDWILNPMYSDASKIRERLAYELWDIMNSSGERANSSRLKHAEVFINGEYWGLYGLQERVDNKQVKGDKRADILYKVKTNDRPGVSELLDCASREICRAFEPQYPDMYGGSAMDMWTPAAYYMAALEGYALKANCALDMPNAVDYGLWAMLAQAHDCHFKNQFLNCVYENGGYAMYKLPWDLNNTFGDVWKNDRADNNYVEFMIGGLVMDGLFERAVDSGDEVIYAAIRARWAQLRAREISEAKLIARARDMFARIAPAIERDGKRWPECGMGEGNAGDISDIELFINTMVPRVDAFVDALGA